MQSSQAAYVLLFLIMVGSQPVCDVPSGVNVCDLDSFTQQYTVSCILLLLLLQPQAVLVLALHKLAKCWQRVYLCRDLQHRSPWVKCWSLTRKFLSTERWFTRPRMRPASDVFFFWLQGEA
jgi:hypothetical protein